VAFTVDDYRDLIELLRQHPDWKGELRREILDEQFMQLPALVRQNSADIRDLQGVVAQNSADIRELKTIVAQNSIDIRQNSADIKALTAAIEAMRQANDVRFNRLETNFGDMKGTVLELWYRGHPEALAMGRLRKIHVVNVRDLIDLTEAVDEGRISESQGRGLADLDLLISGREGRGDESREAWLAVGVSGTIDDHDVTRAAERAATLRAIGFNAYGAVAGNAVAAPTARLAEELGVEVYERRSA
jgi:hypothetical protein